MRRQAFLLSSGCLAVAFAAGCGKSPPPVEEPSHGINVELAELEIHADSIDRFIHCPPTGELGQAWIPAGVTEASHEPLVTERAIADTLRPFRSCYRKGLMQHPHQQGHAAIVVRVAADGKVAGVENYATCELSRDVLECMVLEASRIKFDAPAAGTNTVVIPAAFAPRGGYSGTTPTANDSYTASAYVALEEARPGLHECEKRDRRASKLIEAQGTFALDVNDQGRIVKQHIEPWVGSQDLLACAAQVMEKLAFPKPPVGGARILARIAFNPRSGSR
jgi:hypothetical protein